MTPAAILKEAFADGVSLALSPAGTIKATGDGAAVNRWLPAIREHKAAIIKALLEASACTGDFKAIRAWLTFIGENDPVIIYEVLARCSTNTDARDYFNQRAAEVARTERKY